MTDISVLTRQREGVNWCDVHRLLREAFKGMEGRIDPTSSLGRMGPDDLARLAATGWTVLAHQERDVVGCGFARVEGDALYLGKLAVAAHRRGEGILRDMLKAFDDIARQDGLRALRLQTRVELLENHETFRRTGFAEVARTAHAGYDHPTSITFERPVQAL